MKSFLRNTVASSALLSMMTGAVIAQDNSDQEAVEPPRFILPYSGDINPFYGDINPFWGDINPFYGDISPFWGDISPFWGDINPFYGDINPFYGDISPFWGDINPFYGDINPFYGDISPFWGDIGPFWGDLSSYWGDISPFDDGTQAAYDGLVDGINHMFDDAENVFGSAIEDGTGASYEEFKAELLARYGIDLSDPASLEHVTDAQRAAFFLGFYDGLMSYSGMDHVDHWMPMINWSPALSQAARAGNGTIVGLLDFGFENTDGLNVHVIAGEGGVLDFNHGAAVAGLIAAPYDGTGVMGVAPNSTIYVYNPFDESLSTNWTDVRDGIEMLSLRGARTINASLGRPGWTLHQDWASILGGWISEDVADIVMVFAAGNDGSAQTVDLDWTGVGSADNLLVVGSVNPNGGISSFSNRPGTACLLVNGVCQDGFRLMDRFLVAPGELILVSDGEGGVIRQSGTSFAAPLVSGAAALVQGRWSWLTPRDVTDVLLLTARDLGAPGTDEVYGRGLLDVGAAMSPLDINDLFVINVDRQRELHSVGLKAGQLTFQSRGDNTLTLFEELNDTVRDFVVSLEDLELDPNFSVEEAEAAAEAYLYEQTASFAGTSFNNTAEYSHLLSQSGNLQISAVAAPADPRDQITGGEFPFQASFSIVDTATDRELRFGSGEGALALNNQDGFGMFSDHRPETGGVNPVLGFASGGAYAMTGLRLGEGTHMSVAFTSVRDEEVFMMPFSGEEVPLYDGLDVYAATAFLADISHEMSDSVTVHASYTHLQEDTGLLGAQGGGSLSFEGGAQTDAITIGAEASLSHGLTLSSSATFAQTRAASFDSGMLAMPDNAYSTAFQLTARRDGVFSGDDAVRLSVIQPLYVESGALEYTAASVGDRETGELTFDTQTWELGGQRPLIAEMLYATPLFGDHADLSVFTRAELSEGSFDQQASGLSTGARFKIEF